jgi:cystathionine beta-lyase
MNMHKETECVHSGTIEDEKLGGMNSPIYTSSAFAYQDKPDNLYPRYFNTPNQKAVVDKLCALEGAEDGVLFSSGMAAISTTILAFVSAGDHVVIMDEVYGGTHDFVTTEFRRLGIDYNFTATDSEVIRAALKDNTRLIVIESPTNPLVNIIDIRAVAALGRANNIITVIDNTFATPIHQNPLALGMDIVVHSGTKYLGGHSDICCGAALTSSDYASRIRATARCLGGSLNAITCYLLERSLKTLALRVERQTANAVLIANFLNNRAGVKQVHYPGLETARGHATAAAQMSGFGAMMSFELDESIPVQRFINALRLIQPALSLGGIDTTICVPAVTSHAGLSAAERQKIGISDALLRLSVGIEHIDDLLEDLNAAFND